ncbi:hypothetical protein TRFO_26803 [Tritrichomonas foetus]|uniref:DNA repair protein rad9 n=1 Tax=Tritrichomonas foetus TaxID=1144522 RepID=A0A1J4K3P3_9EUKA|nr:hypothetical protein TRFO_26803 [Tritrichomonas foetus]|eukprot:OHT05456.1 hypothetical protein TRFO_26803 [Tritrichomonas foetus]
MLSFLFSILHEGRSDFSASFYLFCKMKTTIINTEHIKTFFECFSALRKVSEEIIFCATNSFLSVRALNNSQTSLPILTFKDSFFGEYNYETDEPKLCFQIIGKFIVFLKKMSCPTSIIMTFDPIEWKVYFELIDRLGIFHKYEFFASEAQVYDAVHGKIHLLSASIVTEELYTIRESFKCPYIILSHQMTKDDIPIISIESYNSDDSSKISKCTLAHSRICNIKTNNECKVAVSMQDFITCVKIAKAVDQQLEIFASEPGNAFIVIAKNHSHSLKLDASLATLNNDDYIPVPQVEDLCSVRNRTESENENHVGNNLTPPESPVRTISMQNEKQINENGRFSSSNNSQSTQVVPWKVDSMQFVESPVFPNKRKRITVEIDRSQPSEDENTSQQRLF